MFCYCIYSNDLKGEYIRNQMQVLLLRCFFLIFNLMKPASLYDLKLPNFIQSL